MTLPYEVRDHDASFMELFPGAEASEVNLKALHEITEATGLLHACKDGISINIGRKGRRLRASILHKTVPGDPYSCQLLVESDFDDSLQGVAHAIAFLKSCLTHYRTRGPCPQRLARDPPLRRLCVGDLALCASCCLEGAVGL